MDLYGFSLLLGAAGLLVMAFLGVSHGHAGGHAGHGHAGTGHAAHTGPHAHVSHAVHGSQRVFMSLLSPRMIFSFLLGLGTAGVAFKSVVGGPVLFALAVAGGFALERLVVNPLWNFAFRFASNPALTLESAVEDEAKAVTNFDNNGQGLISVEVDGHMVQCLGTLTKTDRESGVRVHAGDTVRIEDVDADRNRCTVRRI